MVVYGFDSVAPLLEHDGYLFKLIANESAVVLFRHTTEHRDAGQAGIHYADEYKDNALAAMVRPRLIEFRFHRAFTDERVRLIAEQLLKQYELQFATDFTVTYQARVLIHGKEQ